MNHIFVILLCNIKPVHDLLLTCIHNPRRINPSKVEQIFHFYGFSRFSIRTDGLSSSDTSNSAPISSVPLYLVYNIHYSLVLFVICSKETLLVSPAVF